MTSISKNAGERKPRSHKLAAILTLGAIVVLGANALLIRDTEPALAASEDIASAGSFRILIPQSNDRLAGLSVSAAAEAEAEVQSVPTLDRASCVATRAAQKTDRHETLDPKTFCQLQHRLFNAELIDRIATLQLASQARLIDASSQFAMNKEF